MKLVVAVLLGLSLNAKAADVCSTLFAEGVSAPRADLKMQMRQQYQSPNLDAYRSLRAILASHPALKADKKLVRSMVALLNDESLSTFHMKMSIALEAIRQLPSDATLEQALATAQTALNAELAKQMTPEMIAQLPKLGDENMTKERLMLALGRMSEAQSLAAFVGSQGPRVIDPQSLVGQYLARAGKQVSTLVDSFSMGPGLQGRGGEKLFVAVDQTTAPLVDQLIGNNPHLLAHDHSVGQGTLHMHFMGRDLTYSGNYNTVSAISFQSGKIVPVMVLSSTEGSYTNNYFTLGMVNMKYAKYPWSLRNSETPNEKSYCKMGGYYSCTHWIGEMGIGDKFVDTYVFPGSNGDDGVDPSFTGGNALQSMPVGTYNSLQSPHEAAESIGTETRTHRLLRMVWTQKRGREQLWSMVGDTNAEGLKAGEWANPGWVVYSFMTRTSYERVPVVFVYVNDASVPLTRQTLDQFKSSISPH